MPTLADTQETQQTALQLKSTLCAICGTTENCTELYPANFTDDAFNAQVFSARRLPDRLHYRLVTCNTCGLVRSNPVLETEQLAQLYQESQFDYHDEVKHIQKTYGDYLDKLKRYGKHQGRLLEIGCGNGFFLEEAKRRGYENVHGVEPGRHAVALAREDIQPNIVCDVLRPNLFEANFFDVICLFQVLDHIPAPQTVLNECYRILKPGGVLLCLNHNVEAVSARLLKDRSPIVDIEHTYLYSPKTMRLLFERHGFTIKRLGMVWNTYSLHYLLRLVPMPKGLKQFLLTQTWLKNLIGSVPLGNLYLVAQK